MVGHRHRLLVRVLLVPKKLVTEQEEVDEPSCFFFLNKDESVTTAMMMDLPEK